MNNEASRSDVQTDVEKIILAYLREKLELDERVTDVKWSDVSTNIDPNGSLNKMVPDAVWSAGSTIFVVECFARVDTPKVGQVHKVAKDVLKLATIKKVVVSGIEVRCILAMPCDIEEYFTGSSWLAAACRLHNVEIIGVEIDDGTRQKLHNASVRQALNMARRDIEEE